MADDPDATRDESVPVDAPTRPAPPLDGGADDLVIPAERYVAGSEIARGGMGRVVEARDTLLGRSVAMKAVLGNDLDARRRFARETRITARLEHPAIVPVYDAGKLPDGAPYIVMRRVSGQPLATVVASTATLAKRLGLLVHVLAAANAVAHAHRRGVLHRDLKPANILVGEFGETVVIDWGLAKVVGEDDPDAPDPGRLEVESSLHTRAGAVFGTPGFMSPEQLAGEAVDARSDVYALGATLYFLLATHPPHHGGTAQAIMDRAASGPAAPIAEVVDGVPQDLAWIVDKALAYDPAQRYADAGEFAADLQAFTTGQLVASRRYSARERLGRFVARHRAWVIAVAALVLIGIAGAIFAVQRILKEQAQTQEALRDANEQLIEQRLQRARSMVVENPTAAVALVKLITDPARWREVRAIAAEARGAGACYGLPGPSQPRTLIIAPDGRTAASTDLEGDVWRHDLVTRRSEMIGSFTRNVGIAFAGDRLVAWSEKRLALFDGAWHEIPHASPIAHVGATPTTIFVASVTGELDRIDVATGRRERNELTAVRQVWPSPDNHTLALVTDIGVVLVDAAGEKPPWPVPGGIPDDVKWGSDSSLLAMRIGHTFELVRTGDKPVVLMREPDNAGALSFAATDVAMYAIVRDSLRRLWPNPIGLARVTDRNFMHIAVTRNGAVVAQYAQRYLSIVHEDFRMQLTAPDELRRIAANPMSPFIVGAMRGRIVVWNADILLPQIADSDAQVLASAGEQSILLGTARGTWEWFDLGTRYRAGFKVVPALYQAYTSRHDTAVLWPLGAQDPVAISRRTNVPVTIKGNATAAFVSDDFILFGDRKGVVSDFDPVSRTGHIVVQRASEVLETAGSRGWQSAMWRDGTLWRRELATGRVEYGAGPAWSWMFQLDDGRACGAVVSAIWCWNPDGTFLPVVQFDMPLLGLLAYDEHHAFVQLQNHTAARVDLDTGIVTSVAGSTDHIGIAPSGGLGVMIQPDMQLRVVDLDANQSWSLAETNPAAQIARITSDASNVITVDGKHVLWWRLHLPTSPGELRPWLDDITNASTEQGTKAMVWK